MSGQVRTTIYLVRHCDVENPRKLIYGYLPNFGLSALGRLQAKALGRFFSKKNVAKLYCTPLQRGQETARAIVAAHPGLEIETTTELAEAEFTKYYQGVRVRDVPWRRPLWFVHKAVPGFLAIDEGVAPMAARVRAPIMRILRDNPGGVGICITHGDPIQAFWNIARGKNRFLRLDCAKGGMLELTYVGTTLENIQYHSPQSIGGPPSPPSPGQDLATT